MRKAGNILGNSEESHVTSRTCLEVVQTNKAHKKKKHTHTPPHPTPPHPCVKPWFYEHGFRSLSTCFWLLTAVQRQSRGWVNSPLAPWNCFPPYSLIRWYSPKAAVRQNQGLAASQVHCHSTNVSLWNANIYPLALYMGIAQEQTGFSLLIDPLGSRPWSGSHLSWASRKWSEPWSIPNTIVSNCWK